MPTFIDFASLLKSPQRQTPPSPDIAFDSVHTGYCWHSKQIPVPQAAPALWTHFGISKNEFAAAVRKDITIHAGENYIPAEDDDILFPIIEPQAETTVWEYWIIRSVRRHKLTYALRSADGTDLFIGQCSKSGVRSKLEPLLCLLHGPYMTASVWQTERAGNALPPWRFACFSNDTPDRVKAEMEDILARLGQPYELWMLAMRINNGVLHSDLLNIIPAGEHRCAHAVASSLPKAKMKASFASPRQICLFWRDFPTEDDAPLMEGIDYVVKGNRQRRKQ